MDASLASGLEQTTLRKVWIRLVPYCFVLYILCYIDRINVSFAAVTMNRDIGLSAHVYGLTAGAFFWGYCLLEIPSNIILQKVGARLWIARIMITWGLLSAATALATGPVSFFIIRVLIGAAEAGLYPGLVIYIYRWFPQRHRGSVIGWFMTSMTLSTAIGAPLSTAFLQLDGVLGLHGWQWIFIGEGLPTVLVGIAVLFVLTERPRDASWLKPAERDWLEGELAKEKHAIEAVRTHSILSAMAEPRVWVLSLLFCGMCMAAVGLILFMPQFLMSAGLTSTQAGLLTAIPYVVGTIAMVVCGKISDRAKNRFGMLVITCGCATVGLVLAAMLHSSLWVLGAFCLATVGIYGVKSPFWPIPSTFLTGPAVAAAVAMINSLGNIGSYLGPIAVGYTKDATGSFEAGIYVLAGAAAVSTLTALGCWLWMPLTARVGAAVPAAGD